MSAITENKIIVVCQQCGVEFAAASDLRRFCDECNRQRKLESRRKYDEKRKEKRTSDTEEDDIHFCDSPEKIQECLNCSKPYCTNCMGSQARRGAKYTRGALLREAKDLVLDCIKQGQTNEEIAEKFKVRVGTVSGWRRSLKAVK